MDTPWRAELVGEADDGTPVYDVLSARNHTVCTVAGPAGPLIAAAPSMLAALKSAQCDCSVRERDSGHKVGCWMPDAIDVIAKATGAA